MRLLGRLPLKKVLTLHSKDFRMRSKLGPRGVNHFRLRHTRLVLRPSESLHPVVLRRVLHCDRSNTLAVFGDLAAVKRWWRILWLHIDGSSASLLRWLNVCTYHLNRRHALILVMSVLLNPQSGGLVAERFGIADSCGPRIHGAGIAATLTGHAWTWSVLLVTAIVIQAAVVVQFVGLPQLLWHGKPLLVILQLRSLRSPCLWLVPFGFPFKDTGALMIIQLLLFLSYWFFIYVWKISWAFGLLLAWFSTSQLLPQLIVVSFLMIELLLFDLIALDLLCLKVKVKGFCFIGLLFFLSYLLLNLLVSRIFINIRGWIHFLIFEDFMAISIWTLLGLLLCTWKIILFNNLKFLITDQIDRGCSDFSILSQHVFLWKLILYRF